MLALVAKAAAILLMMVAVLYLTIRAKRFDYDGFRTVHMRRKYRVPIAKAPSELTAHGSQLKASEASEASERGEASAASKPSSEADTHPPREPPR